MSYGVQTERVVGDRCYEDPGGVVRKALVVVLPDGSKEYNDRVTGDLLVAPVFVDCQDLTRVAHSSLCYDPGGGAAIRRATGYLYQDGTIEYFDTESAAPLGSSPARVDCPSGSYVNEPVPTHTGTRTQFAINSAVTVAATAVPTNARRLSLYNATAADITLTLSGDGGGTFSLAAGQTLVIENPVPELAWAGTYAVATVQGDSGALRAGSLNPALFFNWKGKA